MKVIKREKEMTSEMEQYPNLILKVSPEGKKITIIKNRFGLQPILAALDTMLNANATFLNGEKIDRFLVIQEDKDLLYPESFIPGQKENNTKEQEKAIKPIKYISPLPGITIKQAAVMMMVALLDPDFESKYEAVMMEFNCQKIIRNKIGQKQTITDFIGGIVCEYGKR